MSRSRYIRRLVSCLCVLVPGSVTAARAQTAANVAVVINETSPASVEIGEYYASKRGVPDTNIIRIRVAAEDMVARNVFAQAIEAPLASTLTERGIQDRILYIVVTKGVPLRIQGTAGLAGTAGSVDSELTLLYRRMTGRAVPPAGRIDNPYFVGAGPIADAKPFSHRAHDIYLVTRLDGFSVEDVRGLIDRGLAPQTAGQILLDRRGGAAAATGDLWLVEAMAKLKEAGHAERSDLVETLPPAHETGPVLGYYSWGSSDPANRRRRLGVTFVPGSIAATLAGTDARTFTPPPDDWEPGPDARRMYAGSAHSLLADLIRDGATGAAGNISEPLLASAVRPQILFPAYLAGFNLAEAFYLALPHLSWQSVIVGDPLCRPFQGRTLTGEEIEDPVHEPTGLPGLFAARRMESVRGRKPRPPEHAIASIVRAEIQLASGNKDGARQSLEELTRIAPDLADPHVQLAMILEEKEDFDAAMGHYRRVLELDPRNLVALNNLAYRLAQNPASAEEALPLAKRAATLAPRDPRVLDTLGWIHHLLGNAVDAAKILAEAARVGPDNAEIRLHAATALAAIGSYQAARGHLEEAIRLAPAFETRDDVRELRAALEKRR